MLKQGFRLSIAIQHRVFVIPWVKRHSAPRILCSDQRDYSSSGLISGLIKYVPNKSRKITQDLTSQPLDVTRLDHSVLGSQVKGNSKEARDGTFLDLQEKNDTGSYMNVSCDDSDEGIMSLDKGINASRWDHSVLGSKVKEETGEELEESSNQVRSTGCKSTRQHKQAYDKVKLHMETEQAKSSKEACKTTQEAEHMAIRYLGLRAYSAADLKKKLMGKKYPLEVVDRVINDFQIRGFINDSLYAESFTRSRWSSLSWGPRRIKQALFKKGISNKDSETAIKLVFEKRQCNEGDEEPELNHGLSKEAVDQLYVQASKRWLQGRDLPIETRKARVIRWLQYRGFNWGVVAQLLKRLESTHES
ncbi:Regulatory protein RecX [Arabidopsis suecica]|uniref:Regulatory protein RecX n=1 Tax=Arabidopsis suecica TaxID=45249 RepID=A0A8T2B5F4_ARASU|nr:Regulatory protein RecX [Arabidopsis suecica]